MHLLRTSCVTLALAGTACADAAAPMRPSPYAFDLQGTGLVFHWSADRLPVRVWVAGDAGVVRQFAAEGLQVWSRQFIFGEFRGALVDDSSTADVLVTVGPDTPPAGVPDDAPAALGACSGATEFDVTANQGLAGPFRIALTWDARFPNQDVVNCLERVTVHEVGHAIGIFGHSPDDDDLMNANPRVRSLSPRDRATAEILYHTPATIRPPPTPEGA